MPSQDDSKMVELGYDVWCIVLSHVKRPLPTLGAPVGRKGWHQSDLVACMQVSKSFNAIASLLLYTDPVVSDVWSFAAGASLDVDPRVRVGKAACLAYVKRVFLELPVWDAPVPDDDWIDPVSYEDRLRDRRLSGQVDLSYLSWTHSQREVEDRLKHAHGPCPDEWILRTGEGLEVLGDIDTFTPKRIVLEAFNGAGRRDRLQTDGVSLPTAGPRRLQLEAMQTLSAYGIFVGEVCPTHVCCWNEQIFAHGLHMLFAPAFRNPMVTHHVLLDDDHCLSLEDFETDLTIRFTPPWLATIPTSRTQRSVGNELRDLQRYIRDFESTCRALAGRPNRDKDLPRIGSRRRNPGGDCPMMIGISPCFPGGSMPDHGALGGRAGKSIEDAEYEDTKPCGPSWSGQSGKTATPITAALPSRPDNSTSSSTSPDAVRYSYDYDRYMQAWQDWCEKMNRVGGGKAVRLFLRPPSRCEACGEDQLDPEDPACSGYIDKKFVDAIFKVLGVEERKRDVSGEPMPWRAKVLG